MISKLPDVPLAASAKLDTALSVLTAGIINAVGSSGSPSLFASVFDASFGSSEVSVAAIPLGSSPAAVA